MKNYSNTLLSFLSCIAGLFICPSLYSAIEHPIQYKQISTFNNLPSDEVQQVFQDSDGFLWFATRMGLCQYDGYKVSVYKSNLYTPFLFTNNNVVCVADDNNNNLWIGTLNGLNVLDKKTGKVKQYLSPDIPHNGISFITKTRNNQIWIGTEWGMCRYQPETDTFINIDRLLKKESLGKLSVKSIYEDKDGDLWIGTWMSGLYRYSPSTQQLFSYPEFNKRNSAHTIFQDSNGKMWIGTWREGLYSVDNPKDIANVSFKKYCYVNGDNFSLSDDVVYAIAEDPNTETLWIGTRGGLSIMELNNPGVFVN